MQATKQSTSKLPIKKPPSKLIEDQLSGKSLADMHRTPEIIQFLNLADYSIYPQTEVPLDEPLFKPEPTVLQFSNYEPLDTLTATLRLRNKDKVSRRVKILKPESRLFTLTKPYGNNNVEKGTKVAPGMVTEFLIQFTPETKMDYSYDLVIVTEREKFIVPIRCIGQRAMISFPDVINFGVCPVKHPTDKPVVIRNIGEKSAKWVLTVPPPFYTERSEGFLEIGQVDQVNLSFLPQESRVFQEEMILSYDSLEAYVPIIGEANNDSNVYLSKTFINLKQTYITLSSQDTLKIINKSTVPIDFEWRAFANEREENEKKMKLNLQLSQEEAEERMRVEENMGADSDLESLDSDDSYDELEIKNKRERKLQRELTAVERKYNSIRKAVEDDLMLFQDEIFNIEPQRGKIWPNSEIQITVTFCPQSALHYSCIAYCNVTCSEERLPLNLTAIGIGPEAELSFPEYDIGDVFVNHTQEINHIFIENKGDIEAKYVIVPSESPFGSKFVFEQNEGVLGISELARRQQLKVKFKSELMGEFSETFKIKLIGSSEILSLTFKGHVMPPSFEFDRTEINFGEVSFQFPYSEIVRITNTSEVPFTYRIRVPGDWTLLRKEFEIVPNSGTLRKGETHNIQVDFIPMTVKKYDLVMVVDIDGVGPDMHTLPIRAECFVPKVELIPSDSIDFGPVFLRHPYTHNIELKNRSKLQAKFEMLQQDEQSTIWGIYKPDREEGYIEPKQSTFVEITIIPQKAGPLRIPMYIRVLGDSSQPNMITLLANCTGPIVEVLTPELDFGKVQVLNDYPMTISLHNKSDIEAEYTAFTKNRSSVFRVPDKKGLLQPEEVREIKVLCNADECIPFLDVLHIIIKEGEDREVQLKARGTGTTAFCEEDIKIIDFGTAFTSRNIVRRFFIQNRGRKPQRLRWNRYNSRGLLMAVTTPEKARAATVNTTAVTGRNTRTKDFKDETFIYTVSPVSVTLNPKTGVTFEFTANSVNAGLQKEVLVCTSLVGSERKERTIYECTLKGNFIDPLLKFSENTLYFKYIWEKDVQVEPLTKDLIITSISELPTNFLIKCSPPFSMQKERIILDPGQSEIVRVDFDPGHKIDRISGQSAQKLMIIHQDHPQRDNVDLIGEVCFPNLRLDTNLIDFGCILNDTSKKVYMKMKNNSILDVKYEWNFIEEITMNRNRMVERESEDKPILNQIFDIMPVMGLLKPNQEETVEFVYHSQAGQKHNGIACCFVEGGPEYEVNLKGESSLVSYQLSRYSLDFGSVGFNDSSPQEFYIENTGKVPFEYNISLERLTRKGVVEVQPARGKVAAGDKTRIVVRVIPGVPDKVNEVIVVEVAYYEPILFTIKAQGIYPAILLTLPRSDDQNIDEKLENAKAKMPMDRSIDSTVVQSKNDSKLGRAPKFDNLLMEAEAEIDRLAACEELIKATQEYYSKSSKKAEENKSLSMALEEFQGKIIAATWVCNFGNMVLGNARTKQIRLVNSGQLPVSFAWDHKFLKLNGLTVEPGKSPRLSPGEQILLTFKFQSSKKTMPFGPIKTITNISVKGGLTYQIHFIANLTTPDFTMSSETIDFGKVLVGTLSIAKLRLENTHEVPCEWKHVPKFMAPGVGQGVRDWERFQLVPSEGILQPNQRQTIDVIFTPTQEKSISQKLEFKITDNQVKKVLTVKGTGVAYNLEFNPSKVVLGPVLPYKHTAYQIVQLTNTSDYNIEVYSLDFDKQFKKEEEMIKSFEGFDTLDETLSKTTQNPDATTAKPQPKALYLEPRQPGQPLWKELVQAHERRQLRIERAQKEKEMQELLESGTEEQKKIAEDYFKNKIEEVDEPEDKLPAFIPFQDRHSVIVWGRPLRGSSITAINLAQRHGRLLLRPDNCIEWHINNNTPLNEKIQARLTALSAEREQVIAEREKVKKGRKKMEEEPLNEALFRQLGEDIWVEAIRTRVLQTDCNAGVVVDGLSSNYYLNESLGAEYFSKALGEQNLHLVIVEEKEENAVVRTPKYDEAVETDPIHEEEMADDEFEWEIIDTKVLENYLHIKPSVIHILQHPYNKSEEEKKDEDSAENSHRNLGPREVHEIAAKRTKSDMLKEAIKFILPPVFPDPESLPLPPPKVLQIVNKPKHRSKRANLSQFSLWTPINQTLLHKEEGKEGEVSTGPELDLNPSNLNKTQSRWIIKAQSTLYIVVKFWSSEVGSYENTLSFEIVGSSKQFQLPCSCVCDFPSISTDPRNLFMRRKKIRPTTVPECFINKHFISSENKYEFGPLMIGKNFDKRYDESCKRTNAEAFRISNSGKYPIKIDFALRSVADNAKTVFSYEPDSMQLAVDETRDLTVWAFPDGIGVFNDILIGLIQNNPKPLIIPLSCEGEKPKAEIEFDKLQFDRILLKQKLTKSFVIRSTCKIPIKWSLGGIENLPEEFTIDKRDGILKPHEESTVSVTFTAIKQQKFIQKLTVDITDAEGINMKLDPLPLSMEAEAFDININLNFGNDEGIVNFNNVRVFDEAARNISIKNIGMYEIKYSFIIKKKQTKDLFKFEPMEGTLNPNQEQQISVKFKCDKETNLRTTKNTSDIRLQIMEGRSLEKFEELPINVAVNAVFSKYSIYPLGNINFGPLQYGESKTRTFELRNDGIFDYDFTVTELIDERTRILEKSKSQSVEEIKDTRKSPGRKPEPAKKQTDKKPVKGKEQVTSVDIGQFHIVPSTGVVHPGSSTVIEVVFNAESSRLYQKTLAIDVAHRDPEDSPKGIPYDLSGESCIPGINTHDLDAIFEEQTVVPSLAITHSQKILSASVFASEENVFLFGTLVASKNPEGVTEKFKIMNCTKIPTNVKFSVKPRTTSKSEGFAFEARPESAYIPPHGHTYVSVSFKPTDMMSYGGIFEAIVDGGEPNPKTHKLSFELRGEGTLPSLSQMGAVIGDDGKSHIKFTKTRVGKKSKAELNLMNNGLVPATVRFEMPYHKHFKLVDSSATTLQPKTSMKFVLEFQPDSVGSSTHEIKMSTLHNPYENVSIVLQGEGYQEDIMFENLPDDREDECKLGDCIVGQEKSITFRLKNYCDSAVKFMWQDKPHFFLSPSVGHLAAKSSKEITLTYKGDEVQNYSGLDLICQSVHIDTKGEFIDWDNSMLETRFVTPKAYERIIKRREEEEKRKREEAEAALKKGKGKAPVKKEEKKPIQGHDLIDDGPDDGEPTIQISEVRREPNHTEIDKTQKQISLKVSVVSDYVRYTCDHREIKFASTLMFATRSFKFNLKNSSMINMSYKFKICNADTGKLDAGPYSVSPREGNVSAGCDEVVTVKFSPGEVDELNERLLICSLSNLAPDLEPLVIELKGRSIRPVCHFELPPTNYREKKAQDMIPIDSSYQILEFESLGTKVKNTKKFYVVNPTNQGYEFRWEPVDKEGTEIALKQFKCLTQAGVILSGKKFEMCFEYTPEVIGTHESYWQFKIPSESISQNFLVVGSVLEPLVLLEVGKIYFGQLLIGGKGRETVNLINNEHIPFSFNFEKSSVRGDDNYGDSLVVNPMSGVIPPQGSLPIEILFSPKKEIEYNFNLVCNIKRKLRPLVLNVKGVGYTISHSVHYENSPVALLLDEPCKINFGQIFVNETQTRTVQIVNNGKFNFDFSWIKPTTSKYLSITPEQGTVKTQQKVEIQIKYFPLNEHKMDKTKLQLAIVSGPTYSFICQGSSRKPGVQFSFLEKDFGPCFVLRTSMPKTEILEITNFDNSAVSIETEFDKLPHLDVQLAPGQVLLPTTADDPELEQKKLKIPITFTPRDYMTYQETIPFDINGVHKVNVVVKGEGCPIKLELANPEHEYLDFGVLKVGNEKTKVINLVNKSKKPVNVTLIDGSGEEEFKKYAVRFHPDEEIIIKPRESVPVEVSFKPTGRLHPFTNEIHMKFANGETRKLCTVNGACHGMELKLMEEAVSFGAVVHGSHQSRKLQLINLGDLPCTFQWDSARYAGMFTITPEKGTVQPNTDITFDITFHPNRIESNIKYEKVACNIQGGEPLYLTLLGTCISAPTESIKDLKFETIVRESQTLKVPVANKSGGKWRVHPSISAHSEQTKFYWTGPPTLEINPGSADYEITYLPMTMTSEGYSHTGTLFFPLPDGTALVYNLVGIAKPPKPVDNIVKEIKAKAQNVINLPIKNWLNETQRFEVNWDIDGSVDPSVLIRGANTIDIPPNSTKEYKLNFVTYKQGVTKFSIKFRNPVSREYIFFNIELRATGQDSQGIVELTSPVREVAHKAIMLANPLDHVIDIDTSIAVCNNDHITLSPHVIRIPPKSESAIEVNYRPLVVGEFAANLVIKSTELGDFPFTLVLKGLTSSSQRSLHFKTAIGTELVQAFRFQHFLKKQVTYQIKIEKLGASGPPDFQVDKPTIDAPGASTYEGNEIALPIRFEPSSLRESRAMITLTHPEGGEYACLLYGQASAPMPQGPIRCPAGKNVGIEFRNPFYEPMEFVIRFDNTSFITTAKSPLRIDSKKSVSIQVTYKVSEGRPNTGRMLITAGDIPPWIYYLSGE